MRTVLIVSPTFPPVDGADMHRVRTSLPFLRENGYEPVVLALDPTEFPGAHDARLSATVPPDMRVRRVRGVSERVLGPLGLRNPALRGLAHLARAGSEIIRRERVALVYFSTTAFPVMPLGRYWRARFGVPYVLDFQDPWYNDYYVRTGVRPPGGRLKFGAANTLARVLEPVTLRRAGHVISVSPAYPDMFRARYPWMRDDQFTVLPFGAAQHDFDVLERLDVQQEVFDPDDGAEHWVYVGRGGDDMRTGLEALFSALRRARVEWPERFERVRLHFVGTDYAGGARARRTVAPVADACGVGDLVEERPQRIPYLEALRCLRDAHALLAVGSDDARYTASKLYPYVLARRPLLAIFHERSSVVDIVRRTRAGTVVTFGDEPRSLVEGRLLDAWFARPLSTPYTDWGTFGEYTAREMTRRQCAVFDHVVQGVTA